jgi:translocation and assembly module TamA
LETAHALDHAVRAAALTAALALTLPAAATVEVVGVDGVLAANVLAYLDLDEEPCDAPRWRIEQQLRRTPLRVRDALQALGYYEPTVSSEITDAAECWHVALTIDPGEPVRIRTLDIALTGEAERDPAFTQSREQAALTDGAILDHGAYELLKRLWSDLARERGYPEAEFLANRIDVYPDEHAADIELKFASGPRYSFGKLQLDQEVLTERLTTSYLTFFEGQPYDARQLSEAYTTLADSGFFRTIDVHPLEPDPATRTIPVAVSLTSASRLHINYGVGFSTDTGPRFRFGRTNRRFNERGHQFGIDALLSPVISEFTANYRLPLRDTRRDWLNFNAGIESQDTDTSESDLFEVGMRRVLERSDDWTRTEMLSWRHERFTIADQEDEDSELLMPGVNWTRLRADSDIRPRIGSKLSLELVAATDAVVSDATFLQVIAEGKWIWSLPRGRRFLVRGQVGTISTDDFPELPASVRFFAGGDNSVRGYDFETLGPVDSDGEVVGGSDVATGSFEFEQPLVARWSLAMFVDSGNAFDGSNFDSKTGAGLGGRWQSPLGPIRIDIAHPFDHPTDDYRVHITLGPDL